MMRDTLKNTKSPCSPWRVQTTTFERADCTQKVTSRKNGESKCIARPIAKTSKSSLHSKKKRWLVILWLNQIREYYTRLD